jgi:hypothetical protein
VQGGKDGLLRALDLRGLGRGEKGGEAGVADVYDPQSGDEQAVLPAGGGYWNGPIVIEGIVALPEGNANDHRATGTLNIGRLP